MATQTSDADVLQVALVHLRDHCALQQAGWIGAQATDAAPVCTSVVAEGECNIEPTQERVRDAVLQRRPVCHEDTSYVPVVDDDVVQGVLLLRRAAAPLTAAEFAEAEALGSLVVVLLRNVAMYASLETLVAQEMTRVVEREASMQLVLDSMTEGLLVCDPSGTIGPIRSRAVSVWFGEPTANMKLADYFADPVAGQWLTMGFDALVDGIMPFAVIADQMPRLVARGDRRYRLGYHPVLVNDEATEVAVTVRDVTAELAQEHADRVNGEIPAIVSILLRDALDFRLLSRRSRRCLRASRCVKCSRRASGLCTRSRATR